MDPKPARVRDARDSARFANVQSKHSTSAWNLTSTPTLSCAAYQSVLIVAIPVRLVCDVSLDHLIQGFTVGAVTG